MSHAARAAQATTPPTGIGFPVLLYGTAAAPIFWTGQIFLGYSVSSQICYPGDHPLALAGTPLTFILGGFDAVALLAAMSGFAVAWFAMQRLRAAHTADTDRRIAQGRARFLALWGVFSSLWFFCAILFNTIASLTVPPCLF